MTLTKTPVCDFGKKAEDFKLKSIDNKLISLNDIIGEKATLIMFICNHCPYVKAIQSLLVRDTRELLEYGINSVAIMSNDIESFPEDSYENMQKTTKSSRKVAMFTENEDYSVSREITCWGVIFQNVFSPKATGPAAPSFWGKSLDHFEGPRTI